MLRRFVNRKLMHCFQCEQTSNNVACRNVGVCGKQPTTAGLQDFLVDECKGLAALATLSKVGGKRIPTNVYNLYCEALFSTVTNVNFDDDSLMNYLRHIHECKAAVRKDLPPSVAAQAASADKFARFKPSMSVAEAVAVSEQVGNEARSEQTNADLFSLQELVTYGLKGAVAYMHHAEHIRAAHPNAFSAEKSAEIQDHLLAIGGAFAAPNSATPIDDWVAHALDVGKANLNVMLALDTAHNSAFGAPSAVTVPCTPKVNGRPAIVVSGHDILDLEHILRHSADAGVDVYTHGELLPAHGYPALRKYPHLVGHYGTAWQNQFDEFQDVPGAVLMTTNCIMPPRRKYKDKLFTMNAVSYPGVPHLDSSRPASEWMPQVLAVARRAGAGGFTAEVAAKRKQADVTTGFGHAFVLSLAGEVVGAIKAGHLKDVFVIGGCDGTEGERSYFTDLADATPSSSLILTLGCGKFRFNRKDYGKVPNTPLPRLLDCGQCNDAASAVIIALKLAEALGCGVHDLPLHFGVSWFEQKAVAVLCTLLHLGFKNIRLGPRLPAFLTPNVLNVLVSAFNLKPAIAGQEAADVAAMIAGK